MRMGKSAYRASLEAADEIGLAVIAISLTIVAIFSPVSFMGGIAGQYFRQFGLTVAIAVLFSLLVARFDHAGDRRLFPARAARRGRSGTARCMRFYTRLVRASVRHRWITLFAGARDLRRLALVDASCCRRLHPAGRLRPRAARGRAAAGLAARGHRPRDARDLGEIARHAGGALGAHLRRQAPRRRGRRAAQGDARHQSRPQDRSAKRRSRTCSSRSARSSPIMPDIRFWFLQGQRPARPAADHRRPRHRRRSTTPRTRSRARCARFPMIENPISTAELDRPELRIAPKPQVAADLGVSTEALVRDDPRRHARRHRRQSRQVQRRRPAGPDPGRA